MARRRLPRAFKSALASYVLDPSEVVYDQDNEVVRLGNGARAGGHILARSQDHFVSVRDPRFGAKGDGFTDDSDAIQAADTYAVSVGYTLFFPPGRYVVRPNAIFMGGASWCGASREQSVIAAKAVSFPNLSGLISCQNRSGFSIRQIGFDLSPATFLPGTGNPGNIYWAVSIQSGTNWKVTDCAFNGIQAQCQALAVDAGSFFEITDNYFRMPAPSPAYNQAINLSFASGLPSDYKVSRNTLRGSGFLTNGMRGIVTDNIVTDWQFGGGLTFGPNDGCIQHTVTGNRCTGGNGMDINGVYPTGIEIWSAFSVVANNYCADNAGDGIGGGAFGMTLKNNTCFNNGRGGAGGSGSGLSLNSITVGGIDYVSSQCSVSDNSLFDTQATPTQKYGYAEYMAGGPPMIANDVHNNKVAGFKTNAYLFTAGERSFRGAQLYGSAAGTVGTLAAGVVYDQIIVVAGARKGDKVGFGYNADTRGFAITANVDADDNAILHVQNITGGSLAFPAGNWNLWVEKFPNSGGY